MGDHGFHFDVAFEHESHGPGVRDLVIGDEHVGARLARTAQQAAADRNVGEDRIGEPGGERVGSGAEGIAEHHHAPGRGHRSQPAPDELAGPGLRWAVAVIESEGTGPHAGAGDRHRGEGRTSIELLGSFHQGTGGESDRRRRVQRLSDGPNRFRNDRGVVEAGDDQDRLGGCGEGFSQGRRDGEGCGPGVRMPVGSGDREKIRGRGMHLNGS